MKRNKDFDKLPLISEIKVYSSGKEFESMWKDKEDLQKEMDEAMDRAAEKAVKEWFKGIKNYFKNTKFEGLSPFIKDEDEKTVYKD